MDERNLDNLSAFEQRTRKNKNKKKNDMCTIKKYLKKIKNTMY